MHPQILDYLPHEVLTDIFLRIPIKSLVTCTCVCKSLCNFIADHRFVNAHLNRPRLASYNNADDLILLRSYSEGNDEAVYSLHLDNESFHEFQTFEFPFRSTVNDIYRIIGCCNGVVCITGDKSSYAEDTILWNPSIRKSVALPKPRITSLTHGEFKLVMGFGFDSKSNDYKVLRIVYLKSSEKPEIDIYRLSSGIWEDISHLGDLGFYRIRRKSAQAYLNGAVHWFASDKRSGSRLVLSFDLGDELFKPIVVPEYGIGFGVSIEVFHPAVLMGNLALIEYKIHTTEEMATEERWCLWVMREYGVAESWTRHLVREVGQEFQSIVGFRKSGELLIRKVGRRHLLSYDPRAERFKELRDDINVSISTWFHMESYTETLVLLGRQVHGEQGRVESAAKKKRKGDVVTRFQWTSLVGRINC